MVARVCLLLLLQSAKCIIWLLEQPRGSLLEYHPRFQDLLGKVKIWRVAIELGRFGAGTAKPTWVYTNSERGLELQARQTHSPMGYSEELVKKTANEHGQVCITGIKDKAGVRFS